MGVDHQNHTVHQANEYNQLGHMVESSPGTNGLISNTGGFGRLFVLPSSDRSAKESGWVLLAASQRVGSIIKDGDNWDLKTGGRWLSSPGGCCS